MFAQTFWQLQDHSTAVPRAPYVLHEHLDKVVKTQRLTGPSGRQRTTTDYSLLLHIHSLWLSVYPLYTQLWADFTNSLPGLGLSPAAVEQKYGYDTTLLGYDRIAAGYPKALTSHHWLAAEFMPAAQRGQLPPYIIPGHVRSAQSFTVGGVTFKPSTAKQARLCWVLSRNAGKESAKGPCVGLVKQIIVLGPPAFEEGPALSEALVQCEWYALSSICDSTKLLLLKRCVQD